MSDLPEPLTPPECDLRGLAFMPLDVARLLDSDLFALSTGEEFKAAVALWCKSWIQVPAASLPDDDRILAHLSGAGARWAKVKAGALRNWVLCSDGRLYHPVVAEKAIEAWSFRVRQRERGARGNVVRWQSPPGSLAPSPPPSPTPSPMGSPVGSPDDRKGQGQGQGERQGERKNSPPSPLRGVRVRNLEGFDEFWKHYPRKVGRGAAEKAWPKAVSAAGGDQELVSAGVKVALALDTLNMAENGRFCPHPATWLSAKRWLDGLDAEPDAQPDLIGPSH